MADEALELVRLRNTFYRDNYRRVVLLLLLCLLVIGSAVMFILYILAHEPQPKYFATTAEGKIFQIVPLDRPNLSKAALLEWVNTAATSAYAYNYVSFRRNLQESSNYFTANGWRQFLSQLESSRNLEAVKTKKLIVSAQATGAPVIQQEGILSGRYAWKVQMPMLVTYQGAATTKIQQALLVTVLVVRVPYVNNPQGLGIAQYIGQSS